MNLFKKISTIYLALTLFLLLTICSTSMAGTLAFSSDRSGRNQIYTVATTDLVGSLHQVTTNGSGSQESRGPAWSVITNKLAYQFGAPGVRGIHMISPVENATDDVRLTFSRSEELDASWSPDGRFIVYAFLVAGVAPHYDIWIHKVGDLTTTSDDQDYELLNRVGIADLRPAWSPDGKRIAFVTFGGSVGLDAEIAVVDVQLNTGSDRIEAVKDSSGAPKVVVLTNNTFVDFDPTWSPESKFIAFSTTRSGGRDIYRMSAESGESDIPNFVRLTTNSAADRNPAWSSAGDQIAFVSERDGNREIYVMPAIGGEATYLTRITNNPSSDDDPSWKGICVDTDGNGTTDNDEDGLCDNWEVNGIDGDGDGNPDYTLIGADINHKDIYLEIDWMEDHKPNKDAINDVVQAFKNAPVKNPGTSDGITLHILSDEQALKHNYAFVFPIPPFIKAVTGIPDFDTVKTSYFGTKGLRDDPNHKAILEARRYAVHYALFVHQYPEYDKYNNIVYDAYGKIVLSGSSGLSELPGNDFIVSLGNFKAIGGHNVGSRAQQAATLMHEFGHNLNLRHGGDDDFNCKPNYLSIMSYTRQFNNDPVIGRKLDFSRKELNVLDKSKLVESKGIGGPAGEYTTYGPLKTNIPPVQYPPVQPVYVHVPGSGSGYYTIITPADQPIDWNMDGDFVDTISSFLDINNYSQFGYCDGASDNNKLAGHDDWSHLQYNFRVSPDFADGSHDTALEVREITYEEAASLSPDSDNDGIINLDDNCPYVSNPDQSDKDDNGIGDVCETAPPFKTCAISSTGAYFIDGGNRNSISSNLIYDAVNKTSTGALKLMAITFNGRVTMQTTTISDVTIAPDGTVNIKGQCMVNAKTGYHFDAALKDVANPGVNKDQFSIKITGPNNFHVEFLNKVIAGGDIAVSWQ